jgi:hypothetical protein
MKIGTRPGAFSCNTPGIGRIVPAWIEKCSQRSIDDKFVTCAGKNLIERRAGLSESVGDGRRAGNER